MTAPMRVLVAEDEYVLALHIESGLLERGFGVVGPVATLAEAVALLDGGTVPDAAILDVNLGGDRIFPVAHRLQALGVPFVFASGYDRASLPAEFDDVPLCLKPIDIDQALRLLGT